MTPEKFRSIALKLAGVVESSHMGHPDFRHKGKVFATLGYPDGAFAMVKLSPDQQRRFIKDAPKVFSPSKGAWGLSGSTLVHLASARLPIVTEAILTAYQNVPDPAKKPRK
jgi:hypothetical protein